MFPTAEQGAASALRSIATVLGDGRLLLLNRQAVGRGIAVALLATSFAVLYSGVLLKLARDWATDDNYSHGFLIPPLAAYLIWERRARLAEATRKPTFLGLLLVAASLGVLMSGLLGAELFLTRISILGVTAGAVLFLGGWAPLRVLAFPLAFLVLMIPIPSIVFNQLTFPLQLLASRVAELTLSALGVPVLREGNVIVLAHISLEVVEACSGLRSVMSLLTLALILGYFADSRPFVRVCLASLSVPVAILVNGVRIAGTGVAAQYVGPEAAVGFFHTFSGWLMFGLSFSPSLSACSNGLPVV